MIRAWTPLPVPPGRAPVPTVAELPGAAALAYRDANGSARTLRGVRAERPSLPELEERLALRHEPQLPLSIGAVLRSG